MRITARSRGKRLVFSGGQVYFEIVMSTSEIIVGKPSALRQKEPI
jgi:hypothetical protein